MVCTFGVIFVCRYPMYVIGTQNDHITSIFNAPLRWCVPLVLFLYVGILWIISWSFKEQKEVSQLLSTLSFRRELHSCCSSDHTILWMESSRCGHPKREFIYWSKCCPTVMWSSSCYNYKFCLNAYLYCNSYAVHSS